jgi:hypothetical protein
MPDINLNLNRLITTQASGYVVDDSYVRGGYRVVTTDSSIWTNAGQDVSDLNYQVELQAKATAGSEASLKVGCLVFDTTAGAYFRCTNASPVTFVESFSGNSDLDAALYVQKGELPTDGSGAIDIASEATLQEALLSSVRVSSDGTSSNLTVTETGSGSDPFMQVILTAADTSVNPSTAANIELRLNLAQNGGDAGSA